MKKYSFLYFICILFNFLSAEMPECQNSPRMTIDSYEISNKQTSILLNNGSIWTYQDIDLFEGCFGWHAGDRIHLVYVYWDGYYLKNVSCQGHVPVKLINSCSESLITFQIQSLRKNTNNTHHIILNDNSKWYIGTWSSSWMGNWCVGDRIIITPQEFVGGAADHLLINIDKLECSQVPSCVRAELLTLPYPVEEDPNQRQPREWKVTLQNIWKNDNDSCMIELDNRLILQCDKTKQLWQCGEEVSFSLDKGNLKLKNLSNSEGVIGKLINQKSKGIQVLTIKNDPTCSKKIVFNDGSHWFADCIQYRWEQGDRVIIAQQGYLGSDTATHVLINLDKQKGDAPTLCRATLLY